MQEQSTWITAGMHCRQIQSSARQVKLELWRTEKQTWRMILRGREWPDVHMRKKNTVALMAAKRAPFNHRRRWEMNSGTWPWLNTWSHVRHKETHRSRGVCSRLRILDVSKSDKCRWSVEKKAGAKDTIESHNQASRLLVTISKLRTRSSARYRLRSTQPWSLASEKVQRMDHQPKRAPSVDGPPRNKRSPLK